MSSGADLLVELRDVTVRFGRTVALDHASASVHAGDTVAVLGPDGAGKSTLLRLLAGIARPGSGQFVTRLSAERVGFAGSSFDLYGDLTVTENLSFFGRVRGMEREKLAERIEAMLSLTELRGARDRLAGHLSGGMRKGLALACALVHEPALLLLDEPSVGVDPLSRQELWDIIAQATASGTALVFTSSYLEEADRAERLLLMSAGKLTETTAEQMMGRVAGWSAWVVPVTDRRMEVRARLAQIVRAPRLYLRPEGLTVLAPDEVAARRLLTGAMGAAFSSEPLTPTPLTFEDGFVLMETADSPVTT